jgi:hypothetical protein
MTASIPVSTLAAFGGLFCKLRISVCACAPITLAEP